MPRIPSDSSVEDTFLRTYSFSLSNTVQDVGLPWKGRSFPLLKSLSILIRIEPDLDFVEWQRHIPVTE